MAKKTIYYPKNAENCSTALKTGAGYPKLYEQ